MNTYEELEEEVERLRAWLREVRARLDIERARTPELAGTEDFEALARDVRAGISAALGDRRPGLAPASPRELPSGNAARIRASRT